jgi:hypothetical protein
MKYTEIVQSLYSDNIYNILKVIQRSIYVTEFNRPSEDVIVIHSGFTFLTHKKTCFEILFSFSLTSNELIILRQKRADWNQRVIPLIHGIRLEKTTKYFDSYYTYIFNKIKVVKNDYELTSSDLKFTSKYLDVQALNDVELETGEIIDHIVIANEDNTILKFNLHRHFSKPFFFDGQSFSLYHHHIPNHDCQYRNQQFDYEQYLKDEYGDDAETAYWNMDR